MNAYEQMRDALVKIRNAMYQDVGGDIIIDMGEDAVNKLIGDALAAPPRNCDVGTAEEQSKRFVAACNGKYCRDCPVRKYWSSKPNGLTSCIHIWAQMPYNESETNSEQKRTNRQGTKRHRERC